MKSSAKDQDIEISVIICTFNTKELTLECLDKLKKSIDFLNKPVETIVVENGTDGTGLLIKNKYPWVKVITQSENTGFARGNNIGIKSANKTAKYYLLLNTDALINPETLQKSIDFVANNPNSDALGCKLVLGDGSMQPSAGNLPTPLSVFSWILGIDLIPILSNLLPQFHPRYKSYFKKDRQVGWVMGAFLFMRSDVIKKAKGFDENYFMYTEEVELCHRINNEGFNIWYTPSFEITHLDKSSTKSEPERHRRIAKNEILGVVYFLRKHYPNKINLVLLLIKFGLILRIIAFFVLGNKNRYRTYLETLKEI